MSPQFQQVAGSPVWQLAFVSFALILVLFEVVRGWRRGLPRQLARLAALIGAYMAAYFGGPAVAPFVAPFFRVPTFIMSILLGAVFALGVILAVRPELTLARD